MNRRCEIYTGAGTYSDPTAEQAVGRVDRQTRITTGISKIVLPTFRERTTQPLTNNKNARTSNIPKEIFDPKNQLAPWQVIGFEGVTMVAELQANEK